MLPRWRGRHVQVVPFDERVLDSLSRQLLVQLNRDRALTDAGTTSDQKNLTTTGHLFRHGRRVRAPTCRGRTTVKWRRSRVAISVMPIRSATAMTEASVVPSGRSP